MRRAAVGVGLTEHAHSLRQVAQWHPNDAVFGTASTPLRAWMRPRRVLTFARTFAGNVSNSFTTASSRICSASKQGLVAVAQIRGCSVPASTNVSIRSTVPAASPVERRYSTMAAAASRTLTGRFLNGSGYISSATSFRYSSMARLPGVRRE
jgi:hypothetical protein